MTERQINERRHWKAMTFPYDYFFPDETPECSICLTEKQAELLRGILEPVGWTTRWWSDSDAEIDHDVIESFRDDIIRRLMMSCCNDGLIFRWTVDGVLQSSDDNGTTWQDAPQEDPRNNSPQFPPLEGSDGSDKKCAAATGASLLIKEQVGDQLTDDMSRYTLAQLINDWVNTVINSGGNIFQALATVIVNQIFALVIATLRPALTDDVYSTLTCILYCNMEDDASFTDDEWETVRSNILSQITGIAGIFLEHLIYLIGAVGLTNLVRSGAADSGDCDDCCPDCSTDWDIFGASHGTIINRGSGYIDVEASNAGANYYVLIKSPDASTCCIVTTVDLLSGSAPTLTGWTDCGQTQTEGAPQHTGIYPYGSACINYFQMQGAGAFTIRIHLASC